MPRQKLTKTALDRATPQDKEYYVWDTDVQGFGVRVQPVTGHRTFIFYCRPGGGRKSSQRKIRIGEYPALTVDQARKKAKVLAGEVAHGRDPGLMRDNRRAEDHAKRTAPTVAAAGENFLIHVGKHNKPRTAKDYRAMWNRHVAVRLGSVKVADVTQKQVKDLHDRLSDTPTQANRVVMLLGAFFNWAEAEGLRAPNTNPARAGRKGIRFFAETPRTRFLLPDEYARLGVALKKAETTGVPAAPARRRKPVEGPTAKHRPKSAGQPIPANPFAVAAIRYLALTGWRESEALEARRSEVDSSQPVVTLTDTKTGRSQRKIGAAARELVRSIPSVDDSPYVFPGALSGQPLREINRVWYAVRYAAGGLCDVPGVEDVTLHTLRHSFASVGASLGYSDEVLAKLLGHKREGMTARYAHLWDTSVQAAADHIAETIAGYLGLAPAPQAQVKDSVAPITRKDRALKLVAGK